MCVYAIISFFGMLHQHHLSIMCYVCLSKMLYSLILTIASNEKPHGISIMWIYDEKIL